MKCFRHIATLLVFFIWISCEESEQRRIPDFPVYLELNLYGTYSTFRNPLDTVVYVKRETVKDYIGYGGILVNIGIDEKYYAYDLCCPNEVDPMIRVYPDSTGMHVECRVCGSKFEIWNGLGQVSKGPSKWNLKRYSTSVIGDYLYVFQ